MTEYQRTAFQEATTNAVRVSIDADVTLVSTLQPVPRVAGVAHQGPLLGGVWPPACADAASSPPAVHFPYAILEIKLADADAPPAWVEVGGWTGGMAGHH